MTKVAIIGSEQSGRTSLAAKLGKKGNVADITMYDFSKNDVVMTTIDANGYPKSLKSLVTALNLSDIALLCIPPEGPDVSTGECLVALDLLQYKHGMIVLTKADTSYAYAQEELEKNIRKIITGTCMENWEFINISTQSFEGLDELKEKILELDEKVAEDSRKQDDKPVRVMVDQSFNVTGIGCVVLGVVSQGTLNVKDKLTAYPSAKPLEVRSIQMHDVDVKSAPTGGRVGLALKGIQSKDIERGFVISEKETVAESFILKCKISPFSAPLSVSDVPHLFVGLQSAPVRLEKIEINGEAAEKASPGDECILHLSGSHEIAFSSSDRFILSNLDAKQRFVGYGFAETEN
ncbi:selenocysteine-specific translation elongation factor [Methanohalophilus levihalophilus]|uniref:EF-Tu/IF-2/RF-3 family GTPase n=1 Tax=Methanohalophilus levihalophilus TaxID=1431282 RepID=UPI001AEB281A|nr:EF-Tu/IF-2/RF-3 family GTPase [Methanohalophilus levihalophilus]MBP2029928.1 selenocysteine-specific translation elongation factor [Methanohalophilus levihalophilus]